VRNPAGDRDRRAHVQGALNLAIFAVGIGFNAQNRTNPDGSSTVVQDFEASATITRFFTALMLWQNSPVAHIGYQLGPNETDLRNISGIYDINAVTTFLANYIEHRLPDANSRTHLIADELQAAINQTTQASWSYFNNAAFKPQKSIVVVDETLRRLAGYMQIHGITYLKPSEVEA
jgi:hypothetical protein